MIAVKSLTSIAENITCLGTKRGKNWNFSNRKKCFQTPNNFSFLCPMGVTAGKQFALIVAHCILGYYFSSSPVPLWKSKCSWKVHCFYLEFSVFYIKESSTSQLTMAPAKSRKIVVMGFRSVGNFWIVLAICRRDLAGSFCSVTMLSIFTRIFYFLYFSFQENLQLQFSSWRDNLSIHTIRQLRTVSDFVEFVWRKNSEGEPWTLTRLTLAWCNI